jgi:HTH-type transcriptional regulator, competence development regulator
MQTSTFGSELKRLRVSKELTQRTLAERVGVDPTYISRIERGRVDHLPSVKTVQRLAQALSVDELELLGQADRLPAGLDVMAADPAGREFLRRVTERTPSADEWRRLTASLDEQVARTAR